MLHVLVCLLLIVLLLPVFLQLLSVCFAVVVLMVRGVVLFFGELFGMLPALCWFGLVLVVCALMFI